MYSAPHLSADAKPLNTFSAGPLVETNATNGVAVFTGYGLERGDTRSAEVRIANAGARAGRFRLVEVEASNGFDHGSLTLAIEDVSWEHPLILYSGDFGRIPVGGIDLGGFAPGEERTYRFTTRLALLAPDSEMTRGAGGVYEWSVADGVRS